MATKSSVLMTWGLAIPGREAKGLEVFNSAVAYFTGLKSDGILEDFKVGLAEHGAFDQVSGYILLEGSEENVGRMLRSDDYRTLILKAAHIVANMVVVPCFAGDAIPGRVEKIVAARAALGIA